MYHDFLPIGVGVAAFWVAAFSAKLAPPLGGLVYAITSLPLRIPFFGKIYKRLFIDWLKLSFLFKLLGLMVSSSGILVPLMVSFHFYPEFLDRREVLWGVVAAATLTTLGIMHNVHLMSIPDYRQHKDMLEKFSGIKIEHLDEMTTMQLARTHFTDLVSINLFVIVICYGVTAYCLNAIGMLDKDNVHMISPLEGVAGAFAFLRLVLGDPLNLTGTWGVITNIFYGGSLILYTLFFISLSSRLIDVKPTPPKDINQDMKQEIMFAMQTEVLMKLNSISQKLGETHKIENKEHSEENELRGG